MIMAKKQCLVSVMEVTDHPFDPDYQLGLVRNTMVVTGKHYETGCLVVFIPDGCIVPEPFLREMWLWNDDQRKRRLAGKHGNRVKSKSIAGYPSHGLVYGRDWHDKGVWQKALQWKDHWKVGDDVAEELGIICQEIE